MMGDDSALVVSLTGLEETLSQTVHARHVYGHGDVVFGARFVDIISRPSEGAVRIDYSRFHDVVPVDE